MAAAFLFYVNIIEKSRRKYSDPNYGTMGRAEVPYNLCLN